MTDFYSLLTYRTSKVFRVTFLTLFLLLIFQILQGQSSRQQKPPLRERLFYGGNFGLQLGSITDIQVSPVMGIWLLPRIAVAAGPDYRFYKDRINRTIIYGGKGYVEFVVIQNINKVLPLGVNTGVFLHAEDEMLSLETAFWKNPPYYTERFTINTILVGAGISQQMGRRSSVNMMFLWALNDSGYGIYNNPEIRVSFIF
jgi:hypothetical protein